MYQSIVYMWSIVISCECRHKYSQQPVEFMSMLNGSPSVDGDSSYEENCLTVAASRAPDALTWLLYRRHKIFSNTLAQAHARSETSSTTDVEVFLITELIISGLHKLPVSLSSIRNLSIQQTPRLLTRKK